MFSTFPSIFKPRFDTRLPVKFCSDFNFLRSHLYQAFFLSAPWFWHYDLTSCFVGDGLRSDHWQLRVGRMLLCPENTFQFRSWILVLTFMSFFVGPSVMKLFPPLHMLLYWYKSDRHPSHGLLGGGCASSSRLTSLLCRCWMWCGSYSSTLFVTVLPCCWTTNVKECSCSRFAIRISC